LGIVANIIAVVVIDGVFSNANVNDNDDVADHLVVPFGSPLASTPINTWGGGGGAQGHRQLDNAFIVEGGMMV
jgi:hypothetical protein